jgi:hypothetical protein
MFLLSKQIFDLRFGEGAAGISFSSAPPVVSDSRSQQRGAGHNGV